MARGRKAKRWLAASGGLLINGLILGALVMLEAPSLVMDDAPVLLLDLERAPRSRAMDRPSRSRLGRRSAPSRPSAAPAPTASVEEGVSGQSVAETKPEIEDRWRADPKAIDRWKLTEGVPQWGWGRYYRACKGLSSEHMTPDEKERCYGGWSDRKDKRPSPAFIGPIDETRWQTPGRDTTSRFAGEGARKQRCRDYRRGRTPGFSERNLSSTGAPPPGLREGGCF
jgi:hypothetical protein